MPKHVKTGTVHLGIYGGGEVATVGRERRPSPTRMIPTAARKSVPKPVDQRPPHTTHAKGAEPLETAPRQRVRYMRSKRCTTSSI